MVLALDAVILESLVAICIGFAKGCCRCCDFGAEIAVLAVFAKTEKPNPSDVGGLVI